MGLEPIRFHEVHGQNIRLSNNGTEAFRTDSFNQALCFTDRPLAQDEQLIIKVVENSQSWSGTLRVGVTEHDPRLLAYNLPKYVCPDLNMQPGNWGKALEEHHVKLNQEITIFHKRGRVMIRDGERRPEEFITGVPANKPLYILFDVYGNTKKIRIALLNSRSPVPVAGAGAAPASTATAAAPIRSEAFGAAGFKRASFLDFDSEFIKVSSTTASSGGELSPRSHFAVTKTPLTGKQTLVVRLKKLHNSKPIRMILTSEEPLSVYDHGNLDKLCDNTYSLAIASEITKTGDDLAISIARSGIVYVSHSNRRWMERIHVDVELDYHVVFDMENIGEMTMIGITEDLEPFEGPPSPAQVPEPIREANPSSPPDCIICLETPRSVLLEPCAHYALCEPCAKQLQKSERRECPVCRALIKGVKKIYMI